MIVNLKPVFTVNGTDFSPMLKDINAMKVSYEKREGDNGGLMKNGDMTVDIIAWKAIIEVETQGVSAEWIPLLLAEMINDYVSVSFIDPRTNNPRTGTFIPSVVESPMAFFADGDVKWYNSTTITLTEK